MQAGGARDSTEFPEDTADPSFENMPSEVPTNTPGRQSTSSSAQVNPPRSSVTSNATDKKASSSQKLRNLNQLSQSLGGVEAGDGQIKITQNDQTGALLVTMSK